MVLYQAFYLGCVSIDVLTFRAESYKRAKTTSCLGCTGSEGTVDKLQWHTGDSFMGGHLLIGGFRCCTDGRQMMVAPLDQLRDLLLYPRLPRTTTKKPKHRGEAKKAENLNGTACPSSSSSRKCWTWSPAALRHKIAAAAQWASLCPLGAMEVRKGRGRTHSPTTTLAPHQRAHRGRRKGEGFKHHSQIFFS